MEHARPAMELRRQLAERVACLRVPDEPQLMDRTVHCALDWFGVAAASTETDVASLLLGMGMVEVAPSHRRTGALVLGQMGVGEPLWAARVNGAIGHSQDFDDTHVDSGVHVSAAVLPALLAALAYRPATSGRDLLDAYTVGMWVCEVLSVEGAGPRLLREGLHPTATLGGIAAAAAAGRLLSLPPQRIDTAIGLATSGAYGTVASFGSLAKPLQAGSAAANGLLAVLLARGGITAGDWSESDEVAGGPVLRVLLPDAEAVAATLHTVGDDDLATAALHDGVFNTAHKPYPTCLYTHSAIDTALLLRDDIGPANTPSVIGVTVGVSLEAFVSASVLDPQTGDAGKFSLVYCVAVALSRGQAPLDAFTNRFGQHSGTMSLIPRITVEQRPHLQRFDVEIEVECHDGRRISRQASTSRGHPRQPLSCQELEQKFFQNLQAVTTREVAEGCSEIVLGLASAADARDQCEKLWRGLWGAAQT